MGYGSNTVYTSRLVPSVMSRLQVKAHLIDTMVRHRDCQEHTPEIARYASHIMALRVPWLWKYFSLDPSVEELGRIDSEGFIHARDVPSGVIGRINRPDLLEFKHSIDASGYHGEDYESPGVGLYESKTIAQSRDRRCNWPNCSRCSLRDFQDCWHVVCTVDTRFGRRSRDHNRRCLVLAWYPELELYFCRDHGSVGSPCL